MGGGGRLPGLGIGGPEALFGASGTGPDPTPAAEPDSVGGSGGPPPDVFGGAGTGIPDCALPGGAYAGIDPGCACGGTGIILGEAPGDGRACGAAVAAAPAVFGAASGADDCGGTAFADDDGVTVAVGADAPGETAGGDA
jgi:hypothetical protein